MVFNTLFSGRKDDGAAGDLYNAAVTQARRPEFYQELAVPDTVDGRFDLLALHVFLLLHRLGQSGRPAKRLSQAVFDLMFADMEANLREMGVSDLAVGGRVKTMAQAFYGRISAYEPGLDDAERLQEALSRNLYRGVEMRLSVLEAMVGYVQGEGVALARQPFEELKEGRVTFGEPPLSGEAS
ncbi:ubiquinol-cytochrome C chaperone family protein [Telmatospirillum sp.]|uniref:ubiquinol-cytochrome C chaperone family protein n=1 Tax=Telmatospirillum sp. TaxID=2079197 RepID=UPI002840B07D|nr:ubiquinol-cytochrome C chaperone family protein [Telmatospirillum sp.]MDR3440837.1 ubiquinol-cytochrome C chaperone family protein [Telmatospirillum sp.]